MPCIHPTWLPFLTQRKLLSYYVTEKSEAVKCSRKGELSHEKSFSVLLGSHFS